MEEERPPSEGVSNRLLHLIQGKGFISKKNEASTPATTPAEDALDKLLHVALERAFTSLEGFTLRSLHLDAVLQLIQAFEAVRLFELEQNPEPVSGRRFYINIWQIVGTAVWVRTIGCPDAKGLSEIQPYAAEGAVYCAFASAALMLHSLAQLRETAIDVVQAECPVPDGATFLAEELEHIALCENCHDCPEGGGQ